ncbi:MAG: helix-turn-helix domain-containing protein [Gemmatimonadota bacterium]
MAALLGAGLLAMAVRPGPAATVHAHLVASTPAAGYTLRRPPAEIRLVFSEPVEAVLAAIRLALRPKPGGVCRNSRSAIFSCMLSGSLIREGRLRAGLTQAEVAARVGTTQSAIARWETGKALPSLETLTRVLRACGLDLRVGLQPYDPDEGSLLERKLTQSPADRLDELTQTLAFIRAGRAAIAKDHG